MKRIFMVLLALAVMLSAFSVTAFAAQSDKLPVPNNENFYIENGNTYIRGLKTASASSNIKAFLNYWKSSNYTMLSYHPNQKFLKFYLFTDKFINSINNIVTSQNDGLCFNGNYTCSLIIFDLSTGDITFDKACNLSGTSLNSTVSSLCGFILKETIFTNDTTHKFTLDDKWKVAIEGEVFIEDDGGIFDGIPTPTPTPTPTPMTNTLTIHYIYKGGEKAAESVSREVNPGESYSIDSPQISGYSSDIPIVAGTMEGGNIIITVTYSKNTYTLTVHYVHTDGQKAAQDVIRRLEYQEDYEIVSPSLAGYTPDKTTVSGAMPDSDTSLTVTYTKDQGSGGDTPIEPTPPYDPFAPPELPPYDEYDPFKPPEASPYEGYDPFKLPESQPFEGYDPFLPPPISGWSGYDPFVFSQSYRKEEA